MPDANSSKSAEPAAPPIKKPAASSRYYFTDDTEKEIVRYQNEPDPEKRKVIFVEGIKPAFDKLAESMINVYNFHTIGDVAVLKQDCVSMLFECIHKFNATKGHKAFSYFNVIAKNWFIQRGKAVRKVLTTNVCLSRELLNHLEKNNEQMQVRPYEDELLAREFFEILKEDIKTWGSRAGPNAQENKVLEAINVLLKDPDLPSTYNKKEIYLYIREICNMNTKQIVGNLAKFRKRYLAFRKRYEAGKI